MDQDHHNWLTPLLAIILECISAILSLVALLVFFGAADLLEERRFSALITSILLIIVLGYASFKVRRSARKTRQYWRDESAIQIYNQVCSGDLKPFCVFLRPFYVTNKLDFVAPPARAGSAEPSISYELEEQIVSVLKPTPVVALGKPGETFGVGRILANDESWKREASRLIDRALLLICIPSVRPGSKWELDYIKDKGHLSKTIFLKPGYVDYKSSKLLNKDWDMLVGYMKAKGIDFPTFEHAASWGFTRASSGRVFSIDSKGRCVIERFDIESRRRIRKAIAKVSELQKLVNPNNDTFQNTSSPVHHEAQDTETGPAVLKFVSGDKVVHPALGDGIVEEAIQNGSDAFIMVRFVRTGRISPMNPQYLSKPEVV